MEQSVELSVIGHAMMLNGLHRNHYTYTDKKCDEYVLQI